MIVSSFEDPEQWFGVVRLLEHMRYGSQNHFGSALSSSERKRVVWRPSVRESGSPSVFVPEPRIAESLSA